jgi:hypothetical protein
MAGDPGRSVNGMDGAGLLGQHRTPKGGGMALGQRKRRDRVSAKALLPLGLLSLATLLTLATVFIPHIHRSFFLFDDFAIVGLAPTLSLGQLLTAGIGNFFRPVSVWIFGVESRAFGWDHPMGFAVVSFGIHVTNAVLVGAILRALRFRPVPAAVGSVLFFASPWAGEALFWTSTQFDGLCTLGFLLAAWWGLRTLVSTGRKRAVLLTLSGVAAVFSLLSKEMSATLPVLVLVLACLGEEPLRKAIRGALPLFGLLVGILVVYLVVRGRLLPGLMGPQGRPLEILGRTHPWPNLLSAARTMVLPPHRPVLGRFVPGLALVIFWGASLVFGALREPRRVLVAASGFVVSFAPAFFAFFDKGTTNGSRFLYLPGVFAVLLLVCAWRGAPDGVQAAAAATFVLLVLPGLVWQRRVWDTASDLSKGAITAFSTHLPGDRPFHVADLPSAFEEGPYILKAYAFRYYFGGRLKVPVEAEAVTVGVRNGRLVALKTAPDEYGDRIPPGVPRQVIRLTDIQGVGR